MVNMENEYVSITTRGVWHELYEAITGNSQKIPNPTKLKIKDLFAYSPETTIEYERTYGQPVRLLTLKK